MSARQIARISKLSESIEEMRTGIARDSMRRRGTMPAEKRDELDLALKQDAELRTHERDLIKAKKLADAKEASEHDAKFSRLKQQADNVTANIDHLFKYQTLQPGKGASTLQVSTQIQGTGYNHEYETKLPPYTCSVFITEQVHESKPNTVLSFNIQLYRSPGVIFESLVSPFNPGKKFHAELTNAANIILMGWVPIIEMKNSITGWTHSLKDTTPAQTTGGSHSMEWTATPIARFGWTMFTPRVIVITSVVDNMFTVTSGTPTQFSIQRVDKMITHIKKCFDARSSARAQYSQLVRVEALLDSRLIENA